MSHQPHTAPMRTLMAAGAAATMAMIPFSAAQAATDSGASARAEIAAESQRYNNRDRRGGYGRGGYDRDDRRGRYDRRYSRRAAVQQCKRAARRDARYYSGRRAHVTDIRDVERRRGGYRVKGRIALQSPRAGSYRGNRYSYGYGYGNNGYYQRPYDEGRFSCLVRHGRVVDVKFRGIRALR